MARSERPDTMKGQGPLPAQPVAPTLIFAGFARLPANAGTPYGGGVMALEVEVDPYDMRITDAACDCIPGLARKFLTEMLVGSRLEDALQEAVTAIRSRYFSITQRAMIAALEDVLKRYGEFKREGKDKDCSQGSRGD